MSVDFVHLRLHTEYSVSDGTIRLPLLIKRAAEDGMGALAVTDLSNIFCAVKFFKAARGAGIKPIIGCEVNVNDGEKNAAVFRVVLLCCNQAGYFRLCDLLTRAYRADQIDEQPVIQREWLFEGDNSGIIVLSGARAGDIGQALLKGKFENAVELANQWSTHFPNNFYLEIQNAGRDNDEWLNEAVLSVAEKTQLPVVATHPIQFLNPEDALAHDARVCIAEKETLNDPKRVRKFTADQYFLTQAQMKERFSDYPEALENTVEIAKRCNFEFSLGKPVLPLFPTPEGVTLDDFLIEEAKKGLEARLKQLFPDEKTREEMRPKYEARLEFELGTIVQMGFPGYFLIVADFIRWAKENNVPVGPGRGSGAGSLVAFCLLITDLDPLRYDLLFERFLNPERVSMPDFDVDFCQNGRDKVIQYVRQKYGYEAVSQIATFGAMAAKAVVRDVGRVLGVPYSRSDEISKLIPFDPARHITLKEAYEEIPELKARRENDDEIKELLELAEQCEGLVRNIGMHAGGVLIARGKLIDFCPLYCASGSMDIVSQFDKGDVEAVGLVKFDFLGLRTLTVLDLAVQFLKHNYPEYADFNLQTLPFDDPAVYNVFCEGNTTAVFQSESRSAKDLEKKLKPDCFEDLIALMALNRPGPLQSGMVDDFINRKHGLAKPEYFHPSLEPTLKPTYGVIVYQEQVMQIAQVLAGFTLGKADFLRRAMGKKDANQMAKMGEEFRQGAADRKIDPKITDELFNLMAKFAEYGFNKSHSAAYAMIAYQTAWFKAYFPAEFIAATLSLEPSADKFAFLCNDAEENGISVLPPDINASNAVFTPGVDKTIRFGLAAIKGVGDAAAEAIVAERQEKGAYSDFFDFCARLGRKNVNRRVLEALIFAGAFDSLHPNRNSLLEGIDLAMAFVDQKQQTVAQDSLFGEEESLAVHHPPLPDVVPWDATTALQNEKKVLGMYLTGHPFKACESEVRQLAPVSFSNFSATQGHAVIGGLVSAIRKQKTKRGRMAFVTLDDATGTVDVAIYAEALGDFPLTEDMVLIAEGRIVLDEYSGGYRVNADKVYTLASAREAFADLLTLKVDETLDVDKLCALFNEHKAESGVRVAIYYQNDQASCRLQLPPSWRLTLNSSFMNTLNEWLPPDNISVRYRGISSTSTR